jgi:hypothetical protein
MRLATIFALAYFSLLSPISVSPQDKSKPNDERRQASNQPSTPQPSSPTIQINVGTPNEANASQPAKQEVKVETKPFMTHGEWVISGITSIYVLISFLTWRAIRHSSERQLRSYVLPENLALVDGSMMNPPQPARALVPGTAMLIKNSGQTPAYNVISWVQIAIVAPANEYTLTVPRLKEQFPNTLGAGATFNKALWFDRALGAGEIADIASGAKAIYVYGRIEYRDAFKKRHFSNFRLHWIGVFPPPSGSIMNFAVGGNDAD